MKAGRKRGNDTSMANTVNGDDAFRLSLENLEKRKEDK